MSPDAQKTASRGRPTKRGQVIAAAEALFLQNGYAGTSMDAIAGEAGVIKQTVYRYFPGKQELFGAVIEEVSARVFGTDLGPLPGEGEIRSTLTGFSRRFVRLHADPAAVSLYRVVVGEAHRFPELARAFLTNGPEMFTARVAGYLTERARAGDIAPADCERAAGYFLTMLLASFQLGLSLGARPAPDDAEIEHTVHEVVDLFLRAVSPDS